MLPRPRFHIRLTTAVAIVLLVYVVRSAIRRFDFRPDLPQDVIVLVAFVVVVLAVAVARRMGHTEADHRADARRSVGASRPNQMAAAEGKPSEDKSLTHRG